MQRIEKNVSKNILDRMTLDRALKVARKKMDQRQFDEASIIYRDILIKFPGNLKAKIGLKTLKQPSQNELNHLINLYTKGLFQEALDFAEKLIKVFPESITLYNISGASHSGLLQFKQAEEFFHKAIKIKPDYAEAYYNLGSVLRDKGDTKKAIEYFNQAIKIKPEYSEAYFNIGNVLRDEGEKKIAVEHYRKAIKIKPGYAAAHNNLGNILMDQGNLEASIKCFEQLLKIKPGRPQSYYNIGIAQLYSGKVREAKISFKKAIEIKPDYTEAYWNLYGTSKSIEEAQNWIEQCLVADTQYENAILTSAALKAYKGDTKDLENLRSSKFKEHHYMRSFNWAFDLPELPELFFDRWALFDFVIERSVKDRPCYEFGVFRGESFRYFIKTFKKGYGFDTFTGLPEDWHDQKEGTYSSDGIIPDIKGGHFVVGKFEESLPKFFNQERPLASIINFDADLYSSTICALNHSRSVIDKHTILIFDEFIINKNWEEDEYKALTEFCEKNQCHYQVIAVSFYTKQVAVKLVGL